MSYIVGLLISVGLAFIGRKKLRILAIISATCFLYPSFLVTANYVIKESRYLFYKYFASDDYLVDIVPASPCFGSHILSFAEIIQRATKEHAVLPRTLTVIENGLSQDFASLQYPRGLAECLTIFAENTDPNFLSRVPKSVIAKLITTTELHKELEKLSKIENQIRNLNEKSKLLKEELEKFEKNTNKVFLLSGIIISQINDGFYEIKTFDGNPAFLYTNETTFSSRGHFSIYSIVRGKKVVKLRPEFGGFDREVVLYEEVSGFKEMQQQSAYSKETLKAIIPDLAELERQLREAQQSLKDKTPFL